MCGCLKLFSESLSGVSERCLFPHQVFCQLIKQTAGVGKEEVDSPGVLSIWQTLSCMVCTFIPERAIKRYLTMHIKKSVFN